MNNVGLSVVEGVANGLTPFTEPSKRNIALLMERVRGVENTPFRIANLADDAARFGGFNANMYGPTIVRNMYRNAKGYPLTLFGVRIIGASSIAATSGVVPLEVITHEYIAGQQGSSDKGTWANGVQIKFYSYDWKAKNAHHVEVYYLGKLVETFENATMAGLQVDINSNSMYVMVNYSSEYTNPTLIVGTGTITTTSGSSTVTGVGTAFNAAPYTVGTVLKTAAGVEIGRIAIITSATVVVLEKPAAQIVAAVAFKYYVNFTSTFLLAGGTYVAPVEANFYGATIPSRKGLNLLDGVDCQIIGVTENHTLTMAQELYAYVNLRQDALAVINLPLNASEGTIQSYANVFQSTNTSFISGYNVWVKTSDENGGYVTIPGLGCVLGSAYIRVPALQGDYIHIPPAGTDSAFTDVIECYPKVIDQTTLNLYTRSYTINSVVFVQRVGYFVMTSRTFSTNSLYQSVHIRLQTSFYKRLLTQNMGWVIQKPNTPELKKQIYATLYAYFKTEYANGALERSVPFETACAIICDTSNNPSSQPRTDLNVDIEYIPTEAVEGVKISLKRNDGILLIN